MKNTVVTVKKAKEHNVKLTMLTAYDYSTAKLINAAGINLILVGDSLGNVILGYEDTISVTMEDMIHHAKAVAKGAPDALVVVDMPFMSYQTSVYDAVVNAGRLMKEGRANAVKQLLQQEFLYVLILGLLHSLSMHLEDIRFRARVSRQQRSLLMMQLRLKMLEHLQLFLNVCQQNLLR